MQVIIKTFDGDMYILTKFESAEEADRALAGVEKVKMPTGAVIKTSSIASVMPYADYAWQQKQKQNHRRGEYLRDGGWYNNNGRARDADVKLISGELNNLLSSNTQPKIEKGD